MRRTAQVAANDLKLGEVAEQERFAHPRSERFGRAQRTGGGVLKRYADQTAVHGDERQPRVRFRRLSIAVDSSGRVYTGNQDSSDDGVLVDFDPNNACPNDSLSIVLPTRASPQVAVDAQRRFYVTDYNDNTISAYAGGSKKLLKRITQEKGVISISSTAINP